MLHTPKAMRPAAALARNVQAPKHLLHWLIAAACCASMGVAKADNMEPMTMALTWATDTEITAAAKGQAVEVADASPADTGQSSAVLGQAADVGTTDAGLLLGAAEANPLGLVTLGIKAVAYQKIKNSPPVEQPRLWGMYGALG